jgi:hypothetical protein
VRPPTAGSASRRAEQDQAGGERRAEADPGRQRRVASSPATAATMSTPVDSPAPAVPMPRSDAYSGTTDSSR